MSMLQVELCVKRRRRTKEKALLDNYLLLKTEL